MNECPHCGFHIRESETPSQSFTVCPVCGKSPQSSSKKLDTSFSIVGNYLNRLWNILKHPALYFRNLPGDEPVTHALAFALVTHWLGEIFSYLWKLLIGISISDVIQNWLMRAGDSIQIDNPGKNAEWLQIKDQLTNWMVSTGSILTDPFFTLFSIFFASFFIFIGARLLVPRRTLVSFGSTVKIVSYGMSPAILAAIPALGGFVASFYTLVVTIIGVREAYQISNTRATVVALFSKFILLFMFFLGMIFLILSLLQFIF